MSTPPSMHELREVLTLVDSGTWDNVAKMFTVGAVPTYSPSLNLIERLWGRLKRTVLANVLFQTMSDLVAAFRKGVGRISGHRNQMGFMFDHDGLPFRKAA